ncbi:hypothetical protein J4W32_26065, partial [Escherichia coli]
SSLKYHEGFLTMIMPTNDISNLMNLMFVECERDANLADAAFLAMDSTTARLKAPYNSLFGDHRSG